MTHRIAATVPRSWTTIVLLVTSATLFTVQVWDIRRWIKAFDLGNTQAERVAIYLQRLPLGLGQLGTFALTWLSILCGATALIAAFVGSRHASRPARAVGMALVCCNALLVIWYLFSLM
jgi:hypothetical protein